MSVANQVRTAPPLVRVDRQSIVFALGLTGISLIPLVAYLPFLTEPFLKDEGFYASVAQIVRDGGVPYRDAFDNKPPLIFAWYTLSFDLFGENLWAPRLLAAAFCCATVPLIYLEARLLFSRTAGLIAALAFALSIGVADFGTNANTEYFLLLPMAGALVAFTLGTQGGDWRWFVLSGLFSGVAIMTKQVSAFNFLFLSLAALAPAIGITASKATVRRRLIRVALMGAGCAAALAVVAVPFVLSGTFAEMFEGVVTYTLKYSGDISGAKKLGRAVLSPAYLLWNAAPWVLLGLFGAFCVLFDKAGRGGRLLAGWLGASFLGVLVTGRFYDHYYVQLLPALSLLVPAGLQFVYSRWQRTWAKTVLIVIVPIAVLYPLLVTLNIYLQPTADERHIEKFQASSIGDWEVQSPVLAGHLKRLTEPGDYIYNLGFQSELYFYADRRSPTRFLFDHAFSVSEDFEAEALADLRANPPKFVVDSATYEPRDRLESNYYPESIKDFIQEKYDYLGKMFYADVYRLKEDVN